MTTTRDVPAPTPSRLATHVHEQVRERILSGALAQGDRLPEARLARELDVSRVPLREALPRLEADGATTGPGRGAVVRTHVESGRAPTLAALVAPDRAGASTALEPSGPAQALA